MARVINVEACPDDTREQGVVLCHKLGKARLVSLSHNENKIKRPVILALHPRVSLYTFYASTLDRPLRKSPRAKSIAIPRRFSLPSLDNQFAETIIVSIPVARGGVTSAYVAMVVLPVYKPAAEKAF